MSSINTTWLWPADAGSHALVIDLSTGILHWYDAPGCLCGDDGSFIEQTVAEFQAKGTPWPIEPPPADVLAEIKAALYQAAGMHFTF